MGPGYLHRRTTSSQHHRPRRARVRSRREALADAERKLICADLTRSDATTAEVEQLHAPVLRPAARSGPPKRRPAWVRSRTKVNVESRWGRQPQREPAHTRHPRGAGTQRVRAFTCGACTYRFRASVADAGRLVSPWRDGSFMSSPARPLAADACSSTAPLG